MTFLAALVLCLSVDGIDLGPVPLTDPPVVTATASGATVRLSRRDEAAVRAEARERGLTLPDLGPFRLLDSEPSVVPVALACGTCEMGRLWKPPDPRYAKYKATCGSTYPDGPLCLRCSAPCPMPAEPVACGEPTEKGRAGR